MGLLKVEKTLLHLDTGSPEIAPPSDLNAEREKCND